MLPQMTLKEYLKQDRQWHRPLRVAHARFQLRNATTEQERMFWRDVLNANKED